jgi:fucose 4-O-acetylase-like acetyltransferase
MHKWLAKAFDTAALQEKRWTWVDYLRGIAIILVVYRHMLLGMEHGDLFIPPAILTADIGFFSFCMPLFFILSGVFISGSIRRRSVKELIYNRFETLLYPYFIWAFLQVSIQILLSRYTNTGRTIHDYIYILYHPHLLDQFWYLPALFVTTVVFLVLKVKVGLPHWAQLLTGLGLYYLSPHIHDFSLLSDWMGFYIYFALGDAVSAMLFTQRSQQLLQRPMTLLLTIPLFILAEIYYIRNYHYPVDQTTFLIVSVIGCYAMVVLGFNLQRWDILRFLRVLGFNSLPIYIMHLLVAGFARVILIKYLSLHNAIVILCCGIVAGLVIPIVIYNLLIKDGVFWFLFSPRKPAKKDAPPTLDISKINA